MPSKKKALPPFVGAYLKLYKDLGPRGWWPARSPFEVMVGAILTQNTSWKNVERAIGALRQSKVLAPRKIEKLTLGELASLIRSSGYYRQKALKLKALLQWFRNYGYSIKRVHSSFKGQETKLRAELLNIYGVGPETADSILCYAFDLPFFVVDSYTFRWLGRYAPGYSVNKYELLRQKVEDEFANNFKAGELTRHFNEFHALLVYLGKYFCTKRNPACPACPLQKNCAKNISQNPSAPNGSLRASFN